MAEEEGQTELSFQPKLFTSATLKKTVTVSELFKQLKKLSRELNGLEQETVNTQSLDFVTKQLLSPALIKHKEPGIVSYASCCIADILRLYAPDAPYNDNETKTIFSMFIDQLQLLGDSDNQFYPLREYLLTSLATVRTPALLAMLPDADDIISRFFVVLFRVVSPKQPHNIHMQMLDVLQQLLEEPKSVPQDVVDVILVQFTSKRQTENPAAYQLACDLANGTTDILQKYIYQYFNDVILSAAQQRMGGRERSDDGPDERNNNNSLSMASMSDLRSAHTLILQLNRAAPGTLLNVIPQVEEELGVDDVDIRVLATEVLGEMFAEKGFTLAKRYESTWKTWKGRRSDASSLVRIQWVEHAVSLYYHQPQLSRELNAFIVEKMHDVDEKVRQSTCHAISQLEFTHSAQASIDVAVVTALGERCKDRKPAVRSEAIIALASIYSQVYEELERGNQIVTQKFSGIPSAILNLRYVNDPDIDSKVDSVLSGGVFNFNKIKNDSDRCHRLVLVVSTLTHKARNGLFSYMRRQNDAIMLTGMFLDLCEKLRQQQDDNSAQSDISNQLRTVTSKLAAMFPDKTKLENSLLQLIDLQNEEIFEGLRQTMDPKNDMKTVRKFQKTSLKKLTLIAPNLLDTTAPLWKCVGLTTINRGLVPYLIKYASGQDQNGDISFSAAANFLLESIATIFPQMLKSSSDELFDATELRSADKAMAEERLSLMVKFCKSVSAQNNIPNDHRLHNVLAEFVRSGTIRQAKYAAYLLTQGSGCETICGDLINELVDNLNNLHLDSKAPSFAALSRFAQYSPRQFESYSEQLEQFLVQGVLMKPRESIEDSEGEVHNNGTNGSSNGAELNDDVEWVERGQLDDIALGKIYAVKILTNWIIGIDRAELSREKTQLVLGVLRQLIRNEGEIQPDYSHSTSSDKQHLRLTAASCMIKLAKQVHFERMLSTHDMISLSLMVQDPCFEVRSTFLSKKLIPALAAGRIHVRYISAMFLVAHDPEEVMRDNVRRIVAHRLSQVRPQPGSPSIAEECFPRLLHLLAHHPDWDDTQQMQTLELFSPYIEFYVMCVGSIQNVSLLFCYATELKAYRPRPIPGFANKGIPVEAFARRMYVLSDLAQYLVREKSISASWPLNVYPGQLVLPSDCFANLSDAEKLEVPRTSFLDPEFVKNRAKSSASSRARQRAEIKSPKVGDTDVSPKRKKVASAGKQKQQSRRRVAGSKRRSGDDEDVDMLSSAPASDAEDEIVSDSDQE